MISVSEAVDKRKSIRSFISIESNLSKVINFGFLPTIFLNNFIFFFLIMFNPKVKAQ